MTKKGQKCVLCAVVNSPSNMPWLNANMNKCDSIEAAITLAKNESQDAFHEQLKNLLKANAITIIGYRPYRQKRL